LRLLRPGEVIKLNEKGRDAAYSPIGEQIAYVRGAVPNNEVWLVDADGKHDRLVSRGNFPTWSQDGREVFFHSTDDGMVKAANVSGSEPVIRDLVPVSSLYPAVSPNG